MDMTDEELAEIFRGVKITFSKNCRSGLVDRCECWRCRKGRGEEVTEETESVAEANAAVVDKLFKESMDRWIRARSSDG